MDNSGRKVRAYQTAFGDGAIRRRDVRTLTLADLPDGTPDLWWASSPCQDLSVAGPQVGVGGPRSGALWPMVSLLVLPRTVALPRWWRSRTWLAR